MVGAYVELRTMHFYRYVAGLDNERPFIVLNFKKSLAFQFDFSHVGMKIFVFQLRM
jgi:hypothetical protein